MEEMVGPYSLTLSSLPAWSLICTSRKLGIDKAGICLASSAVSSVSLCRVPIWWRWAAVLEMTLQKLFIDSIQPYKGCSNIITLVQMKNVCLKQVSCLIPSFPPWLHIAQQSWSLSTGFLSDEMKPKMPSRSSPCLPQLLMGIFGPDT